MSETTFTWLHLSDLHVGMAGGLGNTLWDSFEGCFFDDLRTQLEKAPSLDAVLFTGDLTQRGAPEEFDALDMRFDRLWKEFRNAGYDPPLLAVPGNHDLQRPPPHEAEAIALSNWWSMRTPLARQRWFWEKEGADLRAFLDRVFNTYMKWWEECPYVLKDERTHLGLLPGDFAQTIEKNGYRFGIVGLNSAFLQLSDAAFEEQLALDRRQLSYLIEQHEQFYRWSDAHDFSLLLTHHPTSWLHQEAQREFREGIYPPNYFDAHLFGHVHEGAHRTTSAGGLPARRSIQAASLFGLEDYAVFKDDKRETNRRVHGYGFGVIKVNSTSQQAYLLEKRRGALRAGDGSLRIALDNAALLHDEGTGYSTPNKLDWPPPKRIEKIPKTRHRPKLPFAKLNGVLMAQTVPGLDKPDTPWTLQALFEHAYERALENCQRSEGTVTRDLNASMHIWTVEDTITRMPLEFGPGCECLRDWRLLEVDAQGAWSTTQFANEYHGWCETNQEPNARKSDRAMPRDDFRGGDQKKVATEEEIIQTISAWIHSAIPDSLCIPRKHADIDARLGLPTGSSARLTALVVEKFHTKFHVAANTDSIIHLSRKEKKAKQ